MATITGIFEGLIIAKEGSGKRGPWKLYNIKVDGKKYGIGFDPVKAATGDRVSFEAEENDKGYMEADPRSFKVVARATPESTATATASTADSNAVIERQTCLKVAGGVVAAQIQAGTLTGQPSAAVASLVSDFMRILHPAPKAKPAPPPMPAPQDDDFPDDDIPF